MDNKREVVNSVRLWVVVLGGGQREVVNSVRLWVVVLGGG